jgi:hypothetical protein
LVVSLFIAKALSEDKSAARPVEITKPEVIGVQSRGTPNADSEQMLPPDAAITTFKLLTIPNIRASPVAE